MKNESVKEEILTELSCLAAWEWEVQFQVVANSNLMSNCFYFLQEN